ncbi:Membrane protein-Ta.t1.c1/CMV receptor [Penicillium frequentans]|nr:Membrane protein-Ta.t1.c1/CMV receptor [Penicillium glabrum]
MFVDWLKHAYISKFNNYRPALYNKFLDVLAKDYYTNAFAGGDHNITRRLGLPVIPLSCIFFRVSVQTYQMFLASLLPQYPSSTAVTSSLSTIQNRHIPPPLPSAPPLSFATILPNVNILFRKVLENAIPSPAQSVQIFTVVLLLTAFIVLLILKLILGMGLLAFARSRYRKMKSLESEQRKTSRGSAHPQSQQDGSSDAIIALRKDEYTVEGGRRSGLWGMVEVGDEKRKLIYGDDPEGLRRVKEKEDQDKNKDKELKIDHVQRYEMVAKKIW